MSMMKRRHFLKIASSISTLGAITGLSGCGFQLRQKPVFHFQTLWLGGSSPVLTHLRRRLRELRIPVVITNNPLEAQVLLQIVSDQISESVVGQTPTGEVREKQLRVRVVFRLWSQGQDPAETEEMIEQTRESSYSETLALAKSEEEALLYEDMRRSIAEQLLWRLAAMRPDPVMP